MAWLSDYSKRIKLTIDNTKVDDTLSNFPILVKLSNSSGITSTDVTDVFTELGSDANRKKIVVTTSDGTTKCYVEIENWSDANEKAWLWIKSPTVVSGTATDLYLYYDSTKPDNTTYVGDTTDVVAQSVWDSNFEAVWHMAQDPNGDAANSIKDSTSNANHGTPIGSMVTADLVDGKIGKGIEFDGVNDSITHSTFLDTIPSALTFEVLQKITGKTGSSQCTLNKHQLLYADRFYLFFTDSNTTALDYEENNHGYIALPFNTDWVLNTYEDRTVVWDTSNGIQFYTDGLSDGGDAAATSLIRNGTADDFYIGSVEGNMLWFKGIIDEVRVSSSPRSADWVKATHYSNRDELITFSIEVPIYISGYVKEGTVPISRQIYLHNRDTGDLVGATTSSGIDGYFYCETTYSGAHYVVCLDDAAGSDYNDLIYGNILPTTSG